MAREPMAGGKLRHRATRAYDIEAEAVGVYSCAGLLVYKQPHAAHPCR